MTTPNNWTSSYNDVFRDRSKFIAPNAAQPMYHFKGTYDRSHNAPDARPPANTANAYVTAYAPFDRSAAPIAANALNNGSGNGNGNGNAYGGNAYGNNGANANGGNTYCGAAPMNGAIAVTAPFVPNPNTTSSALSRCVPGGKDLWNANTAPISGPTGPSRVIYDPNAAQQQQQQPASGFNGSASGSIIGQGANPSLEGEWSRPKYHVPGYSGFVRGKQFRFGDTYGKTTRMALDVPTDLPLEP